MRILVLLLIVLFVGASALQAGEKKPAKPPVELGHVPWERDFDAAIKRATANKKPLLVLFQEVPG